MMANLRRESPEKFELLCGEFNGQACRGCGSPNLAIRPCTTGPHFARVICEDCNRTRWAKAPWTLDRARGFTLDFGKHRGRTRGELADSDEGRSYLSWLATPTRGNPAIAAGIPLDYASQTCSNSFSLRKKDPIDPAKVDGAGSEQRCGYRGLACVDDTLVDRVPSHE
jgi:hypothetical protein